MQAADESDEWESFEKKKEAFSEMRRPQCSQHEYFSGLGIPELNAPLLGDEDFTEHLFSMRESVERHFFYGRGCSLESRRISCVGRRSPILCRYQP